MNHRSENSSKQNVRNNRNTSDKKFIVSHKKNGPVEVTLKTKGKKGNFSAVNKSKSNGNRLNGEKGSKVSDNGKSNWSEILGEQNKLVLKKTLQKNNKIIDQDIARKLIHQDTDKPGHYSHFVTDNYSEASPKKCHSNVSNKAVPIASESIFVIDKAIQCGIFDTTVNESILYEANPVRALGFLLKEMESLAEGERIKKILMEMEQALLRIPMEFGQPSQAEIENMVAKAKLEASTKKLAATSQDMEVAFRSLRKDNATLQQRMQELSDFYKSRECNLECDIKRLKLELNEAIKTVNVNKTIINDLEERNKQLELINMKLSSEIELEQQNKLELDYLRLEKEKLMILSSYKDSKIVSLKNIILESQNDIRDRLECLLELNKKDGLVANVENSIIQGGLAHSSPRSSNNSNAQSFWKNTSGLSMSPLRRLSSNKPSSLSSSKGSSNSRNEPFHEKTHLDYTSRVGGDDDDADDDDDGDDDDNNNDDTFLSSINCSGGVKSDLDNIIKGNDININSSKNLNHLISNKSNRSSEIQHNQNSRIFNQHLKNDEYREISLRNVNSNNNNTEIDPRFESIMNSIKYICNNQAD